MRRIFLPPVVEQLAALGGLLLVTACLDAPHPAVDSRDGGGIDAGGIDAGGIDAGGIDAGGIDGGGIDAGGIDAGGVDAGVDGGGRPDASPATRVVAIAAGWHHTCAVLDNGAVRCWGEGRFGRLGYGREDNVGDTAAAATAGDVVLGGRAVTVAAGDDHTCAVLDTGAVRCWGRGIVGALGYGGSGAGFNIGDDESPATAGDVPLSGPVAQIACGDSFTCALMVDGAVRCWGANTRGQLGVGGTANVVRADMAVAVPLGVGRTATQVAAGPAHACAVLDDGAVRCWGANGHGQLGLGHTRDFGDDPGETPDSVPAVDLSGNAAVRVTAGLHHSCAVLADGSVRCWGEGQLGRLGYAGAYGYDPATTDPVDLGDDESLAAVGAVDVGAMAGSVAAGGYHSCVITRDASLRCWGSHQVGALGYGEATGNVGDDESPASAGDVRVGEAVTAVEAGEDHTCVLLARGAVRCWGVNVDGRLGYGDTAMRGRSADSVPALIGDVPVLDPP